MKGALGLLLRVGVFVGIFSIVGFVLIYGGELVLSVLRDEGVIEVEEVQVNGSPQGSTEEGRDVETLTIVTLLPKDAILAIVAPEFISTEEVPATFGDGERVMGVSIGGEARAYPIDTLSRREIVNDVVGGVPIAVTW